MIDRFDMVKLYGINLIYDTSNNTYNLSKFLRELSKFDAKFIFKNSNSIIKTQTVNDVIESYIQTNDVSRNEVFTFHNKCSNEYKGLYCDLVLLISIGCKLSAKFVLSYVYCCTMNEEININEIINQRKGIIYFIKIDEINKIYKIGKRHKYSTRMNKYGDYILVKEEYVNNFDNVEREMIRRFNKQFDVVEGTREYFTINDANEAILIFNGVINNFNASVGIS